ncbi:MAG: hypothetical protein ACI8RU_002820 [Zhongshania aliphaticivorans]
MFNPPPSARRLAGPITGATQDTRKYIGFPVNHISVGITLRGN